MYTLIPGQDLLSWFLRLAPLWARTTQRGLFRVPETYTGRFGETLNDPPSTNKLSLASYHGRLAYVGVCMSSIRFLSLGVSVSVGSSFLEEGGGDHWRKFIQAPGAGLQVVWGCMERRRGEGETPAASCSQYAIDNSFLSLWRLCAATEFSCFSEKSSSPRASFCLFCVLQTLANHIAYCKSSMYSMIPIPYSILGIPSSS